MDKKGAGGADVTGAGVPGHGLAAVDEVAGQLLQVAGGLQHSVQGAGADDQQGLAPIPQQLPPQAQDPAVIAQH